MSTKQPDAQDRNASFHRETNPQQIPTEWLQDAPKADLSEGETEYYAVLATIERTLANADVLAGHQDGRGETWRVHVLYVRADGARRVSRTYDASVTETADGLQVTPKGLMGSIAVDGEYVTPHSAPVTEAIEDALRELHGISVEVDA
jgi:streptogramin lyase